MTIDDKIRDEKLQYDISQYYHLEKLINMNILQVKKYCILVEQAKFAYSPLGKAFEKQTEKQVSALNSLDLSNKKDELKQIEGGFPQNLMNDFVVNQFKLQDFNKTAELRYK